MLIISGTPIKNSMVIKTTVILVLIESLDKSFIIFVLVVSLRNKIY